MEKKSTNAAHKHPVITIRVISIDPNRGIVSYANFLQPQGPYFKFSATIGVDRETIKMMQPGKGYAVHQCVDEYGTTHWTSAIAYSGGAKPSADVITAKVAAKKAKRQVNSDLLSW